MSIAHDILAPPARPAVRPRRADDAADWSRETPRQAWDPSRKLLASIRSYQSWRARGGVISHVICPLAVLRHRFWTVVTGAEIPINANLGGGLMLPHPNGIVIHTQAKIGENCVIFQQVTVGSREGSGGAPQVGPDVSIGAGAKVLGNIRIGRHATIGANAVVLSDVPEGATAVGIPARIIPRSESRA